MDLLVAHHPYINYQIVLIFKELKASAIRSVPFCGFEVIIHLDLNFLATFIISLLSQQIIISSNFLIIFFFISMNN